MAICDVCKHDMATADGCTKVNIEFPNGQIMPQSTDHFNEPDGRCHDCNAKHGHYHHSGCDAERCPMCGGQLISCGCLDEETD